MTTQQATPNITLLEKAKEYHKLGLAILPFIINPADGKKVPDVKAVPQWQQWQTQPQTNAEFEALHIENYTMFGVVCGTPLNVDEEKVYFIGIDRDVKDSKISPEIKEATAKAVNEMTPYTQREKTRSGGEHLYYFSRTPIKGKKINSIGMEILGEGNLVVVAPSEGYTQINDNLISTVENAGEIFYKALRNNGLLKTDSNGALVAKKQTTTPAPLRPCYEKLMKKYHLEHLEKVALIYEMYYSGMTQDQILEAFKEHQAWEPAPEHTYDPITTESQVKYVIEKAASGNYRYKRDTITGIGFCYDQCPYRNFKDCRRLHPTIEEILKIDSQLEKIKNGDFDDYPTTEEAFVQFVLTLYDYEFSLREVKEALAKLRIEKWITATEAFKEKIFKKADKLQEQTTAQPIIEDDKRSQADRLIDYCIEETTEFFKDQHQTAYVRVKKGCAIAQIAQFLPVGSVTGIENNNFKKEKITIPSPTDKQPNIAQFPQVPQPQFYFELMKVRSQRFKEWLSCLLYKREQKGANSDALSSAINFVSGKCREEGKAYELYNRVAPDPTGDGSIWIDMANDNWQAIHITKKGWEIVNEPPILFYRFKHQKPLLIPYTPESLEKAQEYSKRFFNHTNIKDTEDSKNNKLLTICTIISYLLPTIPHANIIAYGVQGACKSYCFKLIRRLIDPASMELLDSPTDKKELVQQLYHNWLCFFDNLTFLSTEFSNLFCRVVTGAGFSKRELYSDDDDVIYQFVRCLAINGINQVAKKGDLLDRSILIEFDKPASRKLEAEVDAEFLKDASYILGGMLTVLSDAMNRFETIKLENPQRLADFHKWGCAIAESLGYTSDEFTEAYEGEVETQADETINAEPVGIALLKYLEKNSKFTGTATQLLTELNATAIDEKLNINSKSWPREAQPLSRKLNELKPALFKKSYEVISKPGNPRTIIITKTGQKTLPLPIESTLFSNKQDSVHYIKLCQSDVDIHKCDKCQGKQAEFKVTNPSGAVFFGCPGCFEEYKTFAQSQGVKLVDDTMPEYSEEERI